MSLTEQLVARTGTVGHASDPALLEMAKACLLDWVAVTVAGATRPEVGILVRDAITDVAGSHKLIGREERVALRDSVLIHGTASHALDYDDGLPAMSGHASVAILPALLGIAGRAPVSGAALIRAFTVGVEMAGCLGSLVAPSHYGRGFHATATVGAIAAARACADLLSLDVVTTLRAIGLAAPRAAGLKASFGSPAKPLQVGWSGLVGFTSACWAQAGMEAPADGIGDRQGFAATQAADLDVESALAPAPGGAHLLQTRFKRFASCGVTHALLDGLAALRARCAFEAGEPLEMIVRIGRDADRICNIPSPTTGLEARFSLRAVGAMSLLGADLADPDVFQQERFETLRPWTLYDRIRIELDDDWPATHTLIRLRGADGWLEHMQTGAMQPETAPEVLALVTRKFRSLVAPRLGSRRADCLEKLIGAFELSEDAVELIRIAAAEAPYGRTAAVA